MTTQDESTKQKVPRPRRDFKITQDRWCWCGRAAALIVVEYRRVSPGEQNLGVVCSEEHGQIFIEWLRNQLDEDGEIKK